MCVCVCVCVCLATILSCDSFLPDASELVGCSQCVCAHIFICYTVCTPLLMFQQAGDVCVCVCVCVCVHSQYVALCPQLLDSGLISLPAGLHPVSRVQGVEANINLKPNNNTTSHHKSSVSSHTRFTHPFKMSAWSKTDIKKRFCEFLRARRGIGGAHMQLRLLEVTFIYR